MGSMKENHVTTLRSCGGEGLLVAGIVPSSSALAHVASVSYLEGPAAHSDGSIYFSDIAANRIMRLSSGGGTDVYREDSGRANGNTFDLSERLVTCEGAEMGPGGRRRITRTYLRSGKVEVLTERFAGKRYNGPNDVVVDRHGRIFFTDPRYGDRSDLELDVDGVYRIDVDGTVHRILGQPVVERPNGLAVSPDARTLYVIDSHPRPGGSRKVLAFPLDQGGTPGDPTLVYDFAPGRGGDGMSLDIHGNLYVCAGILTPRGPGETDGIPPGIYVITPAGNLLGSIRLPHDTITNCCFSGPDLQTLCILAGPSIYQIAVSIPGYRAGPWPEPATSVATPTTKSSEGLPADV